jgi:DNA-binding NarL/FixJ family response regulator
LRQAAGKFESIGCLLFAAEALTEAAAAFRADGRDSSARTCAARAQVLLDRCPGAHTPALAHAEFDALTAREREITILAAHGMSRKAIANRLVLSVRTIENQLQHAYRKLGITSRTELAAVLDVDSQEVASQKK